MDGGANLMSNLGGAFVIFIIVSVAVIIALRVVLPFSIFKIRELSEELLEEQKKTNEILGALLTELGKTNLEKKAESNERSETKGPLN